jgi:respiratory nitrate reductase beta subunit
MVLNLDKCIGCHTCSVTCKNVWTNRAGMEYAWFNNVESKPGIGYPKEWENQDRWNGGWVRRADGSIRPRQGGRWQLLMRIFANPNLPQIDDYYEPFTFDYDHLHSAPEMKAAPTARPRSLITGERMQKIEWGPNWEEILGGEFAKRSQDRNFDQVQKEIYGQFENTFMMYLPRLCEHCLNPACVASCPSGSIYKREEDGIVLIDQTSAAGGACACRPARTRKSTTTGSPASRRSASCAIPGSRLARLRPASIAASAGSATSACCSTMPTASTRWPRRRKASWWTPSWASTSIRSTRT